MIPFAPSFGGWSHGALAPVAPKDERFLACLRCGWRCPEGRELLTDSGVFCPRGCGAELSEVRA